MMGLGKKEKKFLKIFSFLPRSQNNLSRKQSLTFKMRLSGNERFILLSKQSCKYRRLHLCEFGLKDGSWKQDILFRLQQ